MVSETLPNGAFMAKAANEIQFLYPPHKRREASLQKEIKLLFPNA
jgi:hypothetical protein